MLLSAMNCLLPEDSLIADNNIHTKTKCKHNTRVQNEENKECEEEYGCD